MTPETQPLNELNLMRDTLQRLSEEKGILRRAARLLELVARSSVGLGEVLQDYARQGSGQLHDVLRASSHLAAGIQCEPEELEALQNIHFVLKTTKAVLEMTPVAMQRNKAEMLGEKEKFSRADITHLAHDFLLAPEIMRWLENEDSGCIFAAMAAQGEAREHQAADSTRPTMAAHH